MGLFHSCPFAEYSDVETGLESVIVKSISFGDEEVKTPVRSISFKGEAMEPTIFKSLGSGKMIIEGSVSFKESELEAIISRASSLADKQKDEFNTLSREKSSEIDNQSPHLANSVDMLRQVPLLDPNNPKHQAAIKLQKVYKSFRTRRKLADCAVLVEQSWWKLLDFAELKRSSISFFDIEKHETAISRWSRAKNRAAKVGKGLSKNDKAQKLALQHWLEAIDPRHRYGHNLHFYYEEWLHSKSREPFFYWLDIGEGREVHLVDKCPRWKLHQQCIKYLGPMERMAYEVVVKDGGFFYRQTEDILHTLGDIEAKWIFVLSASKTMYVGKKKKGTFQHSSFLAGGATTAAGRLVVENGKLKAVWPHSGHYRPTEENFKDFISFLEENNVDLTDVKMSPAEEGSVHAKQSSMHIRNHSSEDDLAQALHGLETDETNVEDLSEEKTDSMEHKTPALLQFPNSEGFHGFSRKLANLEIPKRSELFVRLESDNRACNKVSVESPLNGSHSAEEACASEQNDKGQNQKSDAEEEEAIPKEAILQRINSHKGTKSYQLGRQLSCKWTTGAGPRIGCVRDYPSELQFRALEKVNLSPRSACLLRSKLCCTPHSTGCVSPNVFSPTSSGMTLEATTRNMSLPEGGNLLTRNVQHLRAQSSPLRGQQSPNLLQPNSSEYIPFCE